MAQADKVEIVSKPSPSRKFISMFDISEQAANTLYNVANVTVIAATLVGAIAGLVLFWSDSVRDKFAEIRERETDAKIASANLQAEQAKATAESFRRDIATAHAQAEDAKKTAEAFRLDIATANERAAEAQKKAAEFNEIAEREKLARTKLEAKLTPRWMTEDQAQAIVQKLQKYKGNRIDVIRIGDSQEITHFASLLIRIAEAADWQCGGPWSTMGGVSGSGIFVSILKGSGNAVEHAQQELVAALRESGHTANPFEPFVDGKPPGALMGPPWDEAKVATIRIYVGEKP